MNTLEKVNSAFDALKAGKELENSSTWKTVQAASGPVLVILTAIVNLTDISLTGGQLTTLSLVIASIGALVNSYLTVATTETLGIKS
jgi:hypothetical protein